LFVSDEAEQQPHLSFWKVEETANLCPQLWQATSKLKGLPLRLKLSPFMREWLKNSYFFKTLRLLQKSANLTTGQRKKMPVESHPTKQRT
jgi:hypothetical protein